MDTAQKRIQALDVMRGITIAAMILFNNPGNWGTTFAPLKHAAWNGLTPTDLAYPFFIFIMGVALCFSLRKYASSGKGAALGRIFRRGVLLFVIGILLANFSKLLGGKLSLENLRIMGVLQRLALVYLLGALIYLLTPQKWHLPIAGGLLLLYILLLHTLGGYVHSGENILSRIDCAVLGPGHLITEKGPDGKFPFEPESLLGTIPCIAQLLLGAFVGKLILDNKADAERVRKIALFGIVLLFAGFLLQYGDPINKKIWTSSYTLVTSGAAALLLALLIEIIDVCGHERWGSFFKVFGTNAIVAYSLSILCAAPLKEFGIRKWLFANIFQPAFGPYWGSLAYGLVFILFIFLLTLPLYKKKVFIRL